MSFLQFNPENFNSFCDILAKRDKDLKQIIQKHGYPTPWIRPNSFQTLVLTILEQQVSLAAAYAAFNRLKNKIGTVTPGKILSLTDEELRACYFTRQKIVYAKGLAEAVQSRTIQLKKMESLPDEEVRARLIQLKGIGNWTVDVYLMHALRRTDLFPLGDLALVNSLKQVKKLKPETSKEKMLAIAEPWRPYRTIASMILWHDYLKRKGTKIQD
jgi:DNA-3-methyladenine glycosylase II